MVLYKYPAFGKTCPKPVWDVSMLPCSMCACCVSGNVWVLVLGIRSVARRCVTAYDTYHRASQALLGEQL